MFAGGNAPDVDARYVLANYVLQGDRQHGLGGRQGFRNINTDLIAFRICQWERDNYERNEILTRRVVRVMV